MDASCSKDVSSSSKFSKRFIESDESIYLETSSESDSNKNNKNITQMNIMKTIFLEIYQLQWTLRIKIMMISGFK